MKDLLFGNAAAARGAYDAGCRIVSSYPGTPSTEITENCAKLPGFYAEWAANEKVALEVAFGASMAGGRALCCMKHVGLNVAADPLFTAAYTGVNAGLVIVVADDPGMHSSQNEQDSRFYARAAQIPMLEPSDSQEIYTFTRLAFELSERYDTPVFLRLTTRVAHGNGLVAPADPLDPVTRPYAQDIGKYVMMPGQARKRHVALRQRLDALRTEQSLYTIDNAPTQTVPLGVVASGTVYQYVREANPSLPVFKPQMIWPLPLEAMAEFAQHCQRLVVVEELEPFLENQLRAHNIPAHGKQFFSPLYELSVPAVAHGLAQAESTLSPAAPWTLHIPTPAAPIAVDALQNTADPVAPPAAPVVEAPPRPPVLCPGCPHRGAYEAIRRLKLHVTGDIGCYTLGAAPPLSVLDSCLCMGGSVGMCHGALLARPQEAAKWIGVIGDSTFFHSGMTGVASAVYNQSQMTLVILDNRTTGMTGHQGHPGTGQRLTGTPSPVLDLPALLRGLGVGCVLTVDPLNLEAMTAALKTALAHPGVSVVVAQSPCVMLPEERRRAHTPAAVSPAACRACGVCLRIGCPAISRTADNKAAIDPAVCIGCSVCGQMCAFKAIE